MEYVMVISLGCPKNTVDSEILSKAVENAGYTLTNDEKKADIAIVNTCAFIEPAVEEAISVILETASLKTGASLKKLIVAGCLTERYREKILEEIPEVDLCIGIDAIPDIGDLIKNGRKAVYSGSREDAGFLNLPRNLSEKNGSAYLKISDGCDNACTYCMIPSIRGRLRSRSIADIVAEAEWLCSENKIREIILVAQDTTAYGTDIYGRPSLVMLLRELVKAGGLKWIRLLYCYPELITDELLDLIKAEDKILNYLDIPFQHASDRILKLMGRKDTLSDYTGLLARIRDRISGIVIRTTFITGFPGESEEDFRILESFVKENRFERVGVFTYYDEDGAPSYKLNGKVEPSVSEARRDRIMEIQKDISRDLNMRRIGRIYDIIIGNVSDDGIFYEGRSYGEAPEIDGLVYVAAKEPLTPGSIARVRILDANDYDLTGETI
ncbi:MAG: 30S ribosomal protein S12 methylthiotransferase RimO [Clostridia bacterium]|nr:30S ribosomal protein S12 methylthiotransferase RimO [Clostridia bacterium]